MKLLITLLILTNLHSYSQRENSWHGKSWAEQRSQQISNQRRIEEAKKEEELNKKLREIEYKRKVEERKKQNLLYWEKRNQETLSKNTVKKDQKERHTIINLNYPETFKGKVISVNKYNRYINYITIDTKHNYINIEISDYNIKIYKMDMKTKIIYGECTQKETISGFEIFTNCTFEFEKKERKKEKKVAKKRIITKSESDFLSKYPKITEKVLTEFKEIPIFYTPSKDIITLKIQKIIYGF